MMVYFNKKNNKNIEELEEDIEYSYNKGKIDFNFFVYPKMSFKFYLII